ncbi:RNA-directed DNA polymerase from mobile element jockey [Plakobranchus ocellatus]|uniref:RNA-directed DNA polymerase from mobile element jockey n=1 Tax=Plakobranchus ocellatus TaxID=259542 RepID=A0AAV4AVA5_9GAST|nr:RNA-directed DNA polymerase from mobile element jockey [Plakobranchus ocellatus]
MVNGRLVHVLESGNLLSNVQCGFRKDHSTLDHLAEGKHLQHLERTIQLCINNVQKWVSENGFRFSVSKTTCVHFHRQRIFTEPALHLDGQPIPVKDRLKATRLRDEASVFSAELEGIALTLTVIKKLTKYHKNFVIYSGSLSALQAIQSKNFKVINIRRLYNLIRKFPSYFHISFVWIPAHVGIQGNENVDKFAKEALNRASCSGKLICWSDLKPKMNAYINSIWQRDWDTEGANKLHEVLPNLGEDLHRRGKGAGRKRETAICSLRVGHTWLTQSYL